MNEITIYLNQLRKNQILALTRLPIALIIIGIISFKINLFFMLLYMPVLISALNNQSYSMRYFRFLDSMHKVNETTDFKSTFLELHHSTQKMYDDDQENFKVRGVGPGGPILMKPHEQKQLTLELEALRHIKSLLEDYKPVKKEEDDPFDDFFEGYSEGNKYE